VRIPLAVSLESRDGSVAKDAKTKNAIIEVVGESTRLRKRPGLVDLGLIRSGTAQLLTHWSGKFRAVIGDFIVSNLAGATHPTTWNSADKDSHVTLSNGDLTASHANLSASCSVVRSTASINSGAWYFEVTIDTLNGSLKAAYIGVANATASLDPNPSTPGSDANAIYVVALGAGSDAYVRHNNSNTTLTGITLSTTAVVGVLVDKDAGTIKFYKNGTLIHSGSLGVTGTLYAATAANTDDTWSGTASFSATPPGATSTDLNPTTDGLPFSAQDSGSNAPESVLMIKNEQQAWVFDTSENLTQITDLDYPGQYTVTLTGLTRSGTTATATTAFDTNFQVGSTVTIAGANQSDYNGAKTVTSVTPSTTRVIPTESKEIALTITRSSTTATATSISEPHGLTNGQQVTIFGADQPEYNGVKTITFLTPTTFSFSVTVTTGPTTPATGSPAITEFVSVNITNTGTAGVTTFHATYTATEFTQLVNAETFEYQGAGTAGGNLPGGTYTVANASASGFDFTYAGGVANTFALGASLRRITPPTISSVTRSNTGLVTVTTSAAHGYRTGKRLTISGATQTEYNVTATITVTSSTTFTYQLAVFFGEVPATPATGAIRFTRVTPESTTIVGASFTFTVANSPTTPATGTITASGGRTTVPGIAYLDGYFTVMDEQGVIYNSAEDDPQNWQPLEYLPALNETGAGVAITKHLNYIVAFKEWSTEFFWNAANEPPGSPLGPVDNAHKLVGCAQGWSVADVCGTLAWIGQDKRAKGRSIYIMVGTEPVKVSTPDIDRILDTDDLSEVHAYGFKVGGHRLYVLTLEDSGITLVFDLDSKAWGEWSSYTVGNAVSVSSITRSGTTATVTFSAAHGLSDGDPVLIAGANQADYNGIHQAFYVSSTVITIEVENSPTTPATGTITGKPYTESYFKFPKYATGEGVDAVLHESDGHLYEISPSVYLDAAAPVNVFARTARIDGGSTQRKTMPSIGVIGDSVDSFCVVRWTDDDSATFSSYRKVVLDDEEPEIRRCGSFKRRSIELRHLANTALQLEALEL
jgi:hypothetical protein